MKLKYCPLCSILHRPVVMTGYGTGGAGFDPQRRKEIFIFTTASRPPMGPTFHTQILQAALSTEVKWSERKADRSPASTEHRISVTFLLHLA
jgi:hypothetical protein